MKRNERLPSIVDTLFMLGAGTYIHDKRVPFVESFRFAVRTLFLFLFRRNSSQTLSIVVVLAKELHHGCVLFYCLCERVKMAYTERCTDGADVHFSVCSFTVLLLCNFMMSPWPFKTQDGKQEKRKVKRVELVMASCKPLAMTVPKKPIPLFVSIAVVIIVEIKESQFSCYFSKMQFCPVRRVQTAKTGPFRCAHWITMTSYNSSTVALPTQPDAWLCRIASLQ